MRFRWVKALAALSSATIFPNIAHAASPIGASNLPNATVSMSIIDYYTPNSNLSSALLVSQAQSSTIGSIWKNDFLPDSRYNSSYITNTIYNSVTSTYGSDPSISANISNNGIGGFAKDTASLNYSFVISGPTNSSVPIDFTTALLSNDNSAGTSHMIYVTKTAFDQLGNPLFEYSIGPELPWTGDPITTSTGQIHEISGLDLEGLGTFSGELFSSTSINLTSASGSLLSIQCVDEDKSAGACGGSVLYNAFLDGYMTYSLNLATNTVYTVSMDLAIQDFGSCSPDSIDPNAQCSDSAYSPPVTEDSYAEVDPTINIQTSFLATNPGYSIAFSAPPTNVVASDVPEPATWVMLMAGLFGIGLTLRGARKDLVDAI